MEDDQTRLQGAEPALTEETLPPAFSGQRSFDAVELNEVFAEAVRGWLVRTPSAATRESYESDLRQFLEFAKIEARNVSELAKVRPEHVAAWRQALQNKGCTNATVRRKMTAIRSLFSYLQTYGYTGANPAHGKFVKAPSVARDGKTVGLSPEDCRRLLNSPDPSTPVGVRDRALLGVLAYSACRVGELVRLKVGDFKKSGEHHVISIIGKGDKERTAPLHPEAVERLIAWLAVGQIDHDRSGPLFSPARTARKLGKDGFAARPFSVRAVEYLVERYVKQAGLDPAVTVHSLRVTALTTARERGSDIIDLQDFAGHADPRTTLTYIRTRDRLSKSPAYVLKY